jgi:hypothetical protein
MPDDQIIICARYLEECRLLLHLQGRMAFNLIIFHKSTTDVRTRRWRRAFFWRKACHNPDESGEDANQREQPKYEANNRPRTKEAQDNDDNGDDKTDVYNEPICL